MALAWDDRRVAEVICTPPREDPRRASGYRITETAVLTCALDCVGAEAIVVRFEAGTVDPSSNEWEAKAGTPILLGHDLAILPINPATDPKKPTMHTPPYGWVTPGLVSPAAHAVGFPLGQARKDISLATGNPSLYRESKHVDGTLNLLSGLKRGIWEFKVSNPLPGTDQEGESPWKGMSGAAVWVDGHIVGVVIEDVHPQQADTLTVVPITSPWKAPPDNLDTPLIEIFNCKDPADWDNVAIDSSLRNVLADHHSRARKLVPKEGLWGRGLELDQMEKFCRQGTEPVYWWWRADPWSGKTALMATFAAHTPPDLSVASFFLNAQDESRRTSDAFIKTILRQLDAIAGRSQPSHLTEGAEEESFQRILAETAKICQEHHQRLVLLIDALDEEDWDPLYHSRPSIASLLPAHPIAQVRIIISSRPNPNLPDDLPEDHPLKRPTARHELKVSPHARKIEEEALRALERLALTKRLAWRIMALIAVAGSGLSVDEVAEILNEDPIEIRHAMARSSLLKGQDRQLPGKKPETVYIPGHSTLPKYIKELLRTGNIRKLQKRIIKRANQYKKSSWPTETSPFFLQSYSKMLVDELETDVSGQRDHSAYILDQSYEVATSQGRWITLFLTEGTPTVPDEEIHKIQSLHVAYFDRGVIGRPELELRLSTLGLSRETTQGTLSQDAAALATVWGVVGQAEKALSLAKSIREPDGRMLALTEMAVAAIEVRRPELARRFLDEAMQSWQTNQYQKIPVLQYMTKKLARCGWHDEAIRAARQIEDMRARSLLLAEIALWVARSGRRETTCDLASRVWEWADHPGDKDLVRALGLCSEALTIIGDSFQSQKYIEKAESLTSGELHPYKWKYPPWARDIVKVARLRCEAETFAKGHKQSGGEITDESNLRGLLQKVDSALGSLYGVSDKGAWELANVAAVIAEAGDLQLGLKLAEKAVKLSARYAEANDERARWSETTPKELAHMLMAAGLIDPVLSILEELQSTGETRLSKSWIDDLPDIHVDVVRHLAEAGRVAQAEQYAERLNRRGWGTSACAIHAASLPVRYSSGNWLEIGEQLRHIVEEEFRRTVANRRSERLNKIRHAIEHSLNQTDGYSLHTKGIRGHTPEMASGYADDVEKCLIRVVNQFKQNAFEHAYDLDERMSALGELSMYIEGLSYNRPTAALEWLPQAQAILSCCREDIEKSAGEHWDGNPIATTWRWFESAGMLVNASVKVDAKRIAESLVEEMVELLHCHSDKIVMPDCLVPTWRALEAADMITSGVAEILKQLTISIDLSKVSLSLHLAQVLATEIAKRRQDMFIVATAMLLELRPDPTNHLYREWYTASLDILNVALRNMRHPLLTKLAQVLLNEYSNSDILWWDKGEILGGLVRAGEPSTRDEALQILTMEDSFADQVTNLPRHILEKLLESDLMSESLN